MVTSTIHMCGSSQIDPQIVLISGIPYLQKQDACKEVVLVLQKAIQLKENPVTLWSDYLFHGIFSIVYHQIQGDLANPTVIDRVLSLLKSSYMEATLHCNIEGKYYSYLIRFQFIHEVFVASSTALQNLQQVMMCIVYSREYIAQRGEFFFIRNPDTFYINATTLSTATECYLCHQPVRDPDGVTCYICGKKCHVNCCRGNQFMVCIPGVLTLCTSCYHSDAPSVQVTLINNSYYVCDLLCKINPLPLLSKEFQLRVVHDLHLIHAVNEQEYLDSVALLYGRFYRKGSFVGCFDEN